MNYEIDQHGRIWLNGGVIIPESSHMWDDYLAWVAAGNKPKEVTAE